MKRELPKYSVLMSVYSKENALFLDQSIQSMYSQTVKPDEIVLVADGILTEELNAVVDSWEENKGIKVIRLPENMGLGKALEIGLRTCSNEIVARMDSDDISEPTRCEIQLRILMDENISVVGSSVAEFIKDKENIVSYKKAEVLHENIKKNMKFRNMINHPTVMFRKSDVIRAGGYRHYPLNEDYYLWIRMLNAGMRFKNVELPLVNMRTNDETYLRRGGWHFYKTQKQLFDYMMEIKYINCVEYSYNVLVRLFVSVLIPNKLRKQMYLRILRSRVN